MSDISSKTEGGPRTDCPQPQEDAITEHTVDIPHRKEFLNTEGLETP